MTNQKSNKPFEEAIQKARSLCLSNFFDAYAALNSLEIALLELQKTNSVMKDCYWDEVWILIFETFFKLDKRDMAHRALLKIEEDLDKTSSLFFDLKCQNAAFVAKWLIHLKLPSEAHRVADKYIGMIDKLLQAPEDSKIDYLNLQEQKRLLEDLRRKTLVAYSEHDKLLAQLDRMVAIDLYEARDGKEAA